MQAAREPSTAVLWRCCTALPLTQTTGASKRTKSPSGGTNQDPAAEAPASLPTEPAGAAERQVGGDQTIAEGDGSAVGAVKINCPVAYGETAAVAAAAVRPGAAGAADGLIENQRDV